MSTSPAFVSTDKGHNCSSPDYCCTVWKGSNRISKVCLVGISCLFFKHKDAGFVQSQNYFSHIKYIAQTKLFNIICCVSSERQCIMPVCPNGPAMHDYQWYRPQVQHLPPVQHAHCASIINSACTHTCAHTHEHTHKHTHTHTNTHIHTQTHTHMHPHTSTKTQMHSDVHTRAHTHTNTHTHTHTHVHTHTHTHTNYVCKFH